MKGVTMTPERISELRRWKAEVPSTAYGEATALAAMRECLDEIERLQSERDALSAALDTIRASVLHERFQLSEMEIGNDAVNAVLGIIDDHDPRPLQDAEGDR